MSIKYKIPMLLTTICTVIIVVVLLFSELFVVPYIKNDIAAKQQDANALLSDADIVELLESVEYRIIFVTIIMFLASFAVTSLIIHIRYVTPILRLKEEAEHYQTRGLMIQPSKRSDELGKLENSFYKMEKELTEEKAKQNRIIASISHDIKTPLTSLMGFSERLIKKDLDKEKQTAYLENIYTQAKNIESIVGEFDEYLNFSLDAELRFQDVDVSFVCKMLEDEYREIMSDKDVRFAVVNHCGPASAVYIDIAKMRRVFANIIGNALRHNHIQGLAVSVIAEENEDIVFFTVNDNGKGVSDADMEHIFEPFYTSDNSRKISGLGLSICDQIMNTHNGSITAENTSRGFSIKLHIQKSKG